MEDDPLYEICLPIIRTYAKKFLRRFTREDREDAIQTVLLQLLTTILPKYNPARGDIRGFITVAIRNAILDFRRRLRSQRRRDAGVELSDDHLATETDASGVADIDSLAQTLVASPEQHIEDSEFFKVMLETKTNSEIGLRLSLSDSAVWSRKNRLKAEIKELIETV